MNDPSNVPNIFFENFITFDQNVVMCLIFSLFFTYKGAGCTEVLAGCACKIVRQAYQGCRHYHTGLSQLPHEELDARGGEHLQGCQEGPGTWPMVPVANSPSCFTCKPINNVMLS